MVSAEVARRAIAPRATSWGRREPWGETGEVAGDRVAEVGERGRSSASSWTQVEDLVVGDVGTGDHVGRTTTAPVSL
jgi:hypothetical protein